MNEKAKKLEKIKEKCENCKCCPLSELRNNIVFGRGNPDADLLFIGEAPGEKEDLSGEPFVGAAGKLLEKTLEETGFDKNSYYIANILKCRPPKNRDPKPSEEDACIGFLEEQISVISPKVIVCLGRISAKRFIKKDFKITDEHGVWFDRSGIPTTAVLHPAAILRDMRKKSIFAEDFKKISQKIKAIKN
jgi:DNA polymerase